MKKLIAVLLSLGFISSANALPSGPLPLYQECSKETIAQGKIDLKNVTYSLEYASNTIDPNGYPLEGRFKLIIQNLPENYIAFISQGNNKTILSSDYITLAGDVYILEFYNVYCQNEIKKIEIKVPSYKTHCYLNDTCDKNPWFDGTNINTNKDYNSTVKNSQKHTMLIIILCIVMIIVVSLIMIFKRRKQNEEMF